MREVLKWSKDYRTGEVVTEKAYKPDNVRGKATIQLMDSEGNITHETVSHNIITPLIQDYQSPYYEAVYQSLMSSSLYGAGIIPTTGSSTPSFGNIVLSDNKDEEDANNMFYKGRVIGWSPRNEAGRPSDPTLGTYNAIDSYVKYDNGYYHAHMVYDFSTSQGNGVINSVWWTPTTGESASSADRKMSMSLPLKAVGYALRFRKHSGIIADLRRNARNELCRVTGGKYYRMLNEKNAINGLEDPVYSVEPCEGLGAHSSLEAHIVDGKLNRSNGSVSANYPSNTSIANINAATITFNRYDENNELISTRTMKWMEEFGDIADCVLRADAIYKNMIWSTKWLFTDADGIVYGYFYLQSGSSSTAKVFPTIDSNGNITENAVYNCYFLFGYDTVNQRWTIKPGISYESLMIMSNGSSRALTPTDKLQAGPGVVYMAAGSTNIGVYNFLDHTFAYAGEYELFLDNCRAGKPSVCCFGPYLTAIATSTQEFRIKFVRGYNAHTKLPEPVVKTSADTMRVQYDYYIQIPYAFTDDGNYIPPIIGEEQEE